MRNESASSSYENWLFLKAVTESSLGLLRRDKTREGAAYSEHIYMSMHAYTRTHYN